MSGCLWERSCRLAVHPESLGHRVFGLGRPKKAMKFMSTANISVNGWRTQGDQTRNCLLYIGFTYGLYKAI